MSCIILGTIIHVYIPAHSQSSPYHHQDDALGHRKEEDGHEEETVVLEQLLWRSGGIEHCHCRANKRSDNGRHHTSVLREKEKQQERVETDTVKRKMRKKCTCTCVK